MRMRKYTPKVLLEVRAEILAVEMVENLKGLPPGQDVPGHLNRTNGKTERFMYDREYKKLQLLIRTQN